MNLKYKVNDAPVVLDLELAEQMIASANHVFLSSHLEDIRRAKNGYKAGLSLAIDFVTKHDGEIVQLNDYETKLILGKEEAICLQPYSNIDLFYYEN